MGSIHLPERVTSINKQHLLFSLGLCLPFIKEPQRTRQRHGVKEVRANGNHHIHRMSLQQLSANLHFRLPGISSKIRHNETGSARFIQRTVEQLNPQVVGVIGSRHSEWKSWVVLDLFLVHLVHIERRIRHHEVEHAKAAVEVFVIAVPLLDVAR